jgi:hypothetical protein
MPFLAKNAESKLLRSEVPSTVQMWLKSWIHPTTVLLRHVDIQTVMDAADAIFSTLLSSANGN